MPYMGYDRIMVSCCISFAVGLVLPIEVGDAA